MKAVRVLSRRVSGVFVSTCLMGCFAAVGLTGTSAANADERKITTSYNINFNGLNIGDFKLWSRLNPQDYELKARARISVLAGLLFDWRGDTSSSGTVRANRPRPSSYSFGYSTSERRETIEVEFSGNLVSDVAVNPPSRRAGSIVPIERKHMRNVLDPLSALVLLTNVGSDKNGREVCTRRLPIFDGKARYDLKLSYKKSTNVNTSEYTGRAYVCKVKFRPIAGHRRGDQESEYAAKNEGIEVWMIPQRKADLFVPYYVYIPTQVGSVSMTSAGFSVEKGGARGALLQ